MKVVYIYADWRTPLIRKAGSTVHVAAISRGLQGLGHEVTILVSHKGRTNPEALDGLRIVELGSPVGRFLRKRTPSTAELSAKSADNGGFRRLIKDVTLLAVDYLEEAVFFCRAALWMRRWRPNAIYERMTRDGASGVRLGSLFRIPTVVEVNASRTFEAEWREPHSRLFANTVRRRERRVLTRASSIVAVSEVIRDYVIENGSSTERVLIVPNAVDLEAYESNAFEIEQLRQTHNLYDTIVIGFVGAFNHWIDFESILTATKPLLDNNSKNRLLLVGDGEQRPLVRQRVAEMGLESRVIFAGHVPHSDVVHYLGLIDVSLALYKKIDGFHFSPMKIFEYMAGGAVTVASQYPPISAVIDHDENGFLVEPGDYLEAQAAIQKLIEDPDLRKRMQSKARAKAGTFTWADNARKTARLLEGGRSLDV